LDLLSQHGHLINFGLKKEENKRVLFSSIESHVDAFHCMCDSWQPFCYLLSIMYYIFVAVCLFYEILTGTVSATCGNLCIKVVSPQSCGLQ